MHSRASYEATPFFSETDTLVDLITLSPFVRKPRTELSFIIFQLGCPREYGLRSLPLALGREIKAKCEL